MANKNTAHATTQTATQLEATVIAKKDTRVDYMVEDGKPIERVFGTLEECKEGCAKVMARYHADGKGVKLQKGTDKPLLDATGKTQPYPDIYISFTVNTPGQDDRYVLARSEGDAVFVVAVADGAYTCERSEKSGGKGFSLTADNAAQRMATMAAKHELSEDEKKKIIRDMIAAMGVKGVRGL